MKPTLIIFAVIIAIVANISALRSSKRGKSNVHKLARYAGLVGLTSFALMLVAVFDLFTQIWVARPGYAGWPVGISAGLVVISSILSLIALFWLRRKSDTREDNLTTDRKPS